MKKQWRKDLEEEKEEINLLQAEITSRLSTLRRAENLRRRRKRKEHARSSFFKDPFKFVKSLFTKEKSGKLKTSKKDPSGRTTNPPIGYATNTPSRTPARRRPSQGD